MLEREPGTYLLTDFLVRSFRRSVLAELGLDRHPELWPDYFGHYRQGSGSRRSRPRAAAEAARWPAVRPAADRLDVGTVGWNANWNCS